MKHHMFQLFRLIHQDNLYARHIPYMINECYFSWKKMNSQSLTHCKGIHMNFSHLKYLFLGSARSGSLNGVPLIYRLPVAGQFSSSDPSVQSTRPSHTLYDKNVSFYVKKDLLEQKSKALLRTQCNGTHSYLDSPKLDLHVNSVSKLQGLEVVGVHRSSVSSSPLGQSAIPSHAL